MCPRFEIGGVPDVSPRLSRGVGKTRRVPDVSPSYSTGVLVGVFEVIGGALFTPADSGCEDVISEFVAGGSHNRADASRAPIEGNVETIEEGGGLQGSTGP